jgi:hypothetical protein
LRTVTYARLPLANLDLVDRDIEARVAAAQVHEGGLLGWVQHGRRDDLHAGGVNRGTGERSRTDGDVLDPIRFPDRPADPHELPRPELGEGFLGDHDRGELGPPYELRVHGHVEGVATHKAGAGGLVDEAHDLRLGPL